MQLSKRVLNAGALAFVLFAAGAGCESDKSSPGGPTPVCSFTVAPPSQAFGADGGTANVTVTTTAACSWTAASNAGWIAITSGGTGTGSGTAAYTVAANPSTEARNGTLTVAGQSHAVTQQGRAPSPCTYQISPSSARFSKDAATGTFTVTSGAGCAWVAASSAGWLAVSAGSPGSGTGTVSYAVSRNLEAAERTATITVADKTFAVRQDGDTGVCSYSVTPVELAPCMAAGSMTATITTTADCPWTATPDSSWLGVSRTSGSGSRTLTITFTDNYDAPRHGIVMVRWPTPTAGQNIHVQQAGCVYGVSRDAFSFASTGGSGAFDVLQQSVPTTCGGPLQDRCVWSAVSNVGWITITSSMPRTGDNPVNFTVAPNTGSTARTGRITVRDKVVTITQTAP